MVRLEFGTSRGWLRHWYTHGHSFTVSWSDFSGQFLIYFRHNRDWFDAWIPEDVLSSWVSRHRDTVRLAAPSWTTGRR